MEVKGGQVHHGGDPMQPDTAGVNSSIDDIRKEGLGESRVSVSSNNPAGAAEPGTVAGGAGGPPKKTADDFRFGKLIGEGSFSSVYLAKEVKTGDEFAIKVCNKQHIIRERKAESIRREKDVLAVLSANRHPKVPFFVRLYATFQDTERLYFVMTFGRGGELLKYLHKVGSFDTACCRFYSGELVLALAHLHKLSIVHRDLKPENILLTERGHILVTDFGSAKILKKEAEDIEIEKKKENEDTEPPPGRTGRNNSFVGTAQYVSPEVLKGKYTSVGPSADLWALGCIVYQFVSGLPPFHGPNEYLIFQKILKLEYEFPAGFDPEAKDLVEKLLKLEHSDRLGINDVDRYSSIQAHPFFQGTNWDTLCDQEPPLILPYLPSTTAGPALRSQISDSLAPGFNPRIIAERSLRDEDDEDFPNMFWGPEGSDKAGSGTGPHHQVSVDSDDDEEEIPLSTLLMDKMNIEQENRNRLVADSTKKSSSSDTLRKLSRSRNFLPADDDDRQERLKEQAKSNAWHAVVKGSLILKQGLVSKRKGLFSRRRMLLLTEGPHLYYCEPNSMVVKGQIPWSATLNPEPKDFRIFFVHTPNRTYYLEDPEGFALEWCKAINEVRQSLYGDSVVSGKK